MADAKFKYALDAATQYIIAKRVKQGKITKKERVINNKRGFPIKA